MRNALHHTHTHTHAPVEWILTEGGRTISGIVGGCDVEERGGDGGDPPPKCWAVGPILADGLGPILTWRI